MRTPKHILLSAMLLTLMAAPPAAGQTRLAVSPDPRLYAGPELEVAHDETEAGERAGAPLPLPRFGGWVGVAKWLSLGSAAGLGTVGFVLKRDSDRLFDRLEARCEAQAETCRDFGPDGSYRDPELEALYQRVVDRDGQAQLSLIGAQVAFGLSVAFFIADFQRDDGPSNIPYDPEQSDGGGLQLTAAPGEIALRWYFE